MSTSRSLVFSVLLSGLVFASAASLLVATGSRPLSIQVDERPVFTGRIQDLATPYLTAVTGLSLGVGLTVLALSGWRNASRQLDRAAEEVRVLKQRLHQQEGMVESLKFSEAKLQAAGLSFFLDGTQNSAPNHQSLPVAPFNQPELTPPTAAHAIPVSPVHPTAYPTAHPTETPRSNPSQPKQQSSQIEELKLSLKQIMNQIEQLQTAQSPDRHEGSVDASMRI